jgi:hypothetical protein
MNRKITTLKKKFIIILRRTVNLGYFGISVILLQELGFPERKFYAFLNRIYTVIIPKQIFWSNIDLFSMKKGILYFNKNLSLEIITNQNFYPWIFIV